jgi:hypothetical protein
VPRAFLFTRDWCWEQVCRMHRQDDKLKSGNLPHTFVDNCCITVVAVVNAVHEFKQSVRNVKSTANPQLQQDSQSSKSPVVD